MPLDLEFWEQEFSTERPSKRTDRERARRSRDQPAPWPNRRLPFSLRADTAHFDRSCPTRPCPYPLTPNPRALRHLTAVCEGRTGLLCRRELVHYHAALLAVSAHWRGWLRPLDAWEPPDGAAEDQFRSLLSHLFARYDVPRFLESAWRAGLTAEGIVYQEWYKLIGRGENIRTARNLPIPLTKRLAHHFVRAPDDFDIPAAFLYAQVVSLGGDGRLVRSLLETRIKADFSENAFWTTVIEWFVLNPSVHPVHHGPIIDYLHNQKFIPSARNPSSRVRGRARQPVLIPPQPNLSMKGRTPEALLRSVERWHRDLGASSVIPFTEWKPSGIVPLVHETGRGGERRAYETTELICTEELQEEGRAMLHCAATYWMRCAAGRSSIWSMTVEDPSGHVERVLTLEVNTECRSLVQARGRSNRNATGEELRILAYWLPTGGPGLYTPPIDIEE